MALPNEETLEFCRQIFKWIDREEMTSEGLVFVFKSDTPKEIIDRFEEIKEKLPFAEQLAN